MTTATDRYERIRDALKMGPTPEMVPAGAKEAELATAPQPQVQQADECGFTELTEKVAEIELAALEEALVKREKALAKWEANGSIGMDEELEAIHKEFHAACYAGRIQNVVYVLKAALADISRLRKAIECSRPIDDSSAALSCDGDENSPQSVNAAAAELNRVLHQFLVGRTQ